MTPKTKTPRAILKGLHEDLKYYQQMYRVDLRSVRASRAKCVELGLKMREIQKEIK